MTPGLYDIRGHRLYCTQGETRAFLKAARQADPAVRLLCLTLALSGCRPSEALALSASRLDTGNQSIIFESLKKRKRGIYRAVPVPQKLLKEMARLCTEPDDRLWLMGRSTAWGKVKTVFNTAGVFGPQATAKGLRHGFAVNAIAAGVPLNMVQKWLGHASIRTTSIYANAMGLEERKLAEKLWRSFR